jgi:hypothetical protein
MAARLLSIAFIASTLGCSPILTGTDIFFSGLGRSTSLPSGPVTLDDEAERARAAARGGDCSTVQAIDVEVRDLDPDYYKTVFMRDTAISLCKPPDDPPFFCTTSPVLAELCFCSNAIAECEERQRSLTAMGATMSNCTASSNDTCRRASSPSP